ncbi:MAG: DUF1697 domain-containing protein [Gemmatimonadetes bacterium]|nr:DUF1697 domain-containing protein [Gemmatimonadota bacterium]
MAERRYTAFLRGIYPGTATQPELRRSFEAAVFADVSTVIASGNVVFTARSATPASLERKAEKAMQQELGRSFLTIVRSIEDMRVMLDADPYARFRLPADAKRVVTFIRDPGPTELELPMKERDGARILAATEGEIFSAYVPNPKGGVFMNVIEDALGEAVTTRTWDTAKKVVARGEA